LLTPRARLEGRNETATAARNNNFEWERINYSSQSHPNRRMILIHGRALREE
jgi:hypothetical protein